MLITLPLIDFICLFIYYFIILCMYLRLLPGSCQPCCMGSASKSQPLPMLTTLWDAELRCMQVDLRDRFGIAPNQAHRALDDCQIMQQVVQHLLRLNGTPTFAHLMRQKSKCSGTLEQILDPGIDFHL